jgi:hypothetical protein
LSSARKRALTKSFKPFSAENFSTKLEEQRPSFRREEGDGRSLLLKSTPESGQLGLEKGAQTKTFARSVLRNIDLTEGDW